MSDDTKLSTQGDLGCFSVIVTIGFIALAIGGIVDGARESERQKRQAARCDTFLAQSRTHSDTLVYRLTCGGTP